MGITRMFEKKEDNVMEILRNASENDKFVVISIDFDGINESPSTRVENAAGAMDALDRIGQTGENWDEDSENESLIIIHNNEIIFNYSTDDDSELEKGHDRESDDDDED